MDNNLVHFYEITLFVTELPTYEQICKDKEEAEVWFVGLNALISRDNYRKERSDGSVDSSNTRTRRSSPSIAPFVCINHFLVFFFLCSFISN